jgi:hypothetical protein
MQLPGQPTAEKRGRKPAALLSTGASRRPRPADLPRQSSHRDTLVMGPSPSSAWLVHDGGDWGTTPGTLINEAHGLQHSGSGRARTSPRLRQRKQVLALQRSAVGCGRAHARDRDRDRGIVGGDLPAVMPAARQSRIILTGTWVPAITAWPCITRGPVEIISSWSAVKTPVCRPEVITAGPAGRAAPARGSHERQSAMHLILGTVTSH